MPTKSHFRSPFVSHIIIFGLGFLVGFLAVTFLSEKFYGKAETIIPTINLVGDTSPPPLELNIIPNASFEDDANQDRIPDGWVFSDYLGGDKRPVDRLRKGEGINCNSAALGACSFRLIGKSENRFRTLRIDIPLAPITVSSVWVSVASKPNQAKLNGLMWSLGSSSGAWNAGGIQLPQGTSETFKTTAKTFKLGQTINANRLSILLQYRGSTGSVDLDDVRVVLQP